MGWYLKTRLKHRWNVYLINKFPLKIGYSFSQISYMKVIITKNEHYVVLHFWNFCNEY